VRLLDLYAGAGGAGMGYHQAGFTVTGIDIDPQPDYPFEFIQADAVAYLATHGHEYDAIHASPPCQTHSALTKGNRARGWADGHRDFIAVTRALLDHLGQPYVLENVQGSTLRRDLTLCGEMFGLDVIRHRYFELGGWEATAPAHVDQWRRAMGIDWMTTRHDLAESIPPAYTAFVGSRLAEHIHGLQEAAA
jgi:DNA (cytosine-5)-methyltransferase 1